MRDVNGVVDRLRGRRRIMVGLLAAAAVALLPGTAVAGTLASGDYTGPDGTQHYELYVPSSYTPSTPVPLVVALHGCTMTADSFRQLTRWDAQAEAKGFILLLPQQDSSRNQFSCWNFFQDSSMHRSAGDPARIAAVTALVENSYNVDPHRVFVTGMSSGGAMASIMGATYPDYFAAIGVGSGCEYAATAACAGFRSADPTMAGQQAYREMGPRARPIPFIAMQGDADTTVPPANADQLVQQWLVTDDLADDGAANGSVPSTPAKTAFGSSAGGRSYTVRTYLDAHRAELAQYWVVRGMKHAWSGGNAAQPYSDPSGPDATAAMYAFFQNHADPSLTRPAPPPAPKAAAPAASASSGATPRRRAPTVSRVRFARGRILFAVSGPGSVTLRLRQRVAGRLKNGRCVVGAGRGPRCSTYRTRAKIVRALTKASRIAIPLPRKVHGRPLPHGRYLAVVTPSSLTGQPGRTRTLALTIR
jgi:poly(hydroxyalkanoate) depolymerase family esterase